MEKGFKDEACVGLDIIGVNQNEGVEVTGNLWTHKRWKTESRTRPAWDWISLE
jgi:predicted secreted hydrolase